MDCTQVQEKKLTWFPLTYLDPAIEGIKKNHYSGFMPSYKTLVADGGRQPSRELDSLLRPPRKLDQFVRWLEFNVGPDYAATFRDRATEVVVGYGKAERYLVTHWYPPPREGADPETHFPDRYNNCDHHTGFTKCAIDKWHEEAVHKAREFYDYLRQMRAMLVHRRSAQSLPTTVETANIEDKSHKRVWCDEGEYCRIVFGTIEKRLKWSAGLRSCQMILDKATKKNPLSATEILGISDCVTKAGFGMQHRVELSSMTAVQRDEFLSSAETKLQDLRKTGGDSAEIETIENYINDFSAESQNKGRLLGPRAPGEQAVDTVSKRLKRASEKLRASGLDELADYLSLHVKGDSGAWTFSPPAGEDDWLFE